MIGELELRKLPAVKIKNELVCEFDLENRHFKVRWGKGTASFRLKIQVDNDIYEMIGKRIEEYAKSKQEEWGFTFNTDDYGKDCPCLAVENFDGLHRYWN